MLDGARARAAQGATAAGSTFRQGDVMALPFADARLRRRDHGLLDAQRRRHRRDVARSRRVLEPGARFVNLDVSKAPNPLFRRLFDLYFYSVVPLIGGLVGGSQQRVPLSAELADELSRTPTNSRRAFADAGFRDVRFVRLGRRRDRRARGDARDRTPRTRCTGATRDLCALVEDFFRNAFATDNPLITEAVRRMLAAGGKRLRPRLTLARRRSERRRRARRICRWPRTWN